MVSIGAIFILGLPLGFSLQTLLIQEQTRRQVSYLLYNQTNTFSNTNIRSIRVQRQGDKLFVELEVAAPFGSISEKQVQEVHNFLEAKLQKPLNFKVQIIPTRQYTVPASES